MERMLTVVVPIHGNEDFIQEIDEMPDASVSSNVVYKYNEKYYRRYEDTNEVVEVTEVEFPHIGQPLELFDFTYDAVRMGTAPTIEASVMWPTCLDDDWTEECHVNFNGEQYYLQKIPTSSKSNEDARYKHEISFVSQRIVLEDVYLYDVVSPYISERPISESSEFSFYGDVSELAKRINISLVRSGLSSLVEKRKDLTQGRFDVVARYIAGSGVIPEPAPTQDEVRVVSRYVNTIDDLTAGWQMYVAPYLTYAQWNDIGTGTDTNQVHINVFNAFNGNYQSFLQSEVYEYQNNHFLTDGYSVVIDDGVESEEKLIVFENNTIHEALQKIKEDFELQYYFKSDTKEIHIGDCEYDFGEENVFSYGIDDALLSIEKANTTEEIVTRITGYGSTENIPWYYPNPTADGWIEPTHKRNGEVLNSANVEHEVEKNEDGTWNAAYEKYLKNRIGNDFAFGNVVLNKHQSNYVNSATGTAGDGSTVVARYTISTKRGFNNIPKLVLKYIVDADALCNRIFARLKDLTDTQNVWEYDSELSYEHPNDFQKMCMGEEWSSLELALNHSYELYFAFTLTEFPLSRDWDFAGYYYPSTEIGGQDVPTAYVPDGFYEEEGLLACVGYWYVPIGGSFNIFPHAAGYSTDGTTATMVQPKTRMLGKKYLDRSTHKVYACTDAGTPTINSNLHQNGYISDVKMDYKEWLDTFLSLSICVYDTDGWYLKGKKIALMDYGITNEPLLTANATIFDTIVFHRTKYLTPQPHLMPEVYYLTDGENRFYTSKNYPIHGTPDATIGEQEMETHIIGSNVNVKNPLYSPTGEETDHFVFENEYLRILPHEHIEEFEDVRPTIVEVKNTMGERIDVVSEFAYDEMDDDSVWENNDDGNTSGEYKHPHFFAKLRVLDFNIFDLALQDDMVISMTTGNCGACNFKIKVDENTGKNPVQIWPYPTGTYVNGEFTEVYEQYTLRRYVDTTNLYYKIVDDDGNVVYKRINESSPRIGWLVNDRTTFNSSTLSAPRIIAGEVGSLNTENATHIEGDVMTSGAFHERQQDTSQYEVWVALEKDTDTYGVLMPLAQPNYEDSVFSRYIRPKSVLDADGEEEADKFVLINIRMPQKYIRTAEQKLSSELIEYMYDNNYQKFNFSIKFSRIFLADNEDVLSRLNENSILYVGYNKQTPYKQYVSHYTYKMAHDAVLPEVSVDMNEELSVVHSSRESERRGLDDIRNEFREEIVRRTNINNERNARRYVGRNSNTLLSGNVVSRIGATSFGDLRSVCNNQSSLLSETMVDLSENHYRRSDFVIDNGRNLRIGSDKFLSAAYIDDDTIKRDGWDAESSAFVSATSLRTTTRSKFNELVGELNSFNANVADKIMQIKYTVEDRTQLTQSGNCTRAGIAFENRMYDLKDNAGTAFWLDKDGASISTSDSCPSAFKITWTEFQINN